MRPTWCQTDRARSGPGLGPHVPEVQPGCCRVCSVCPAAHPSLPTLLCSPAVGCCRELETCRLPQPVLVPGRFFWVFSGNFGAPDERCGLAIWMISCQKQIVSHCQCVCPLNSNSPGSAEGGFQLCGCCAYSTSHRPCSSRGRTNSFLVSAGCPHVVGNGGSCWLDPSAGLSTFIQGDSGL